MALEKYNKKRDFAKTSEPAGEVKPSGDQLRFVVQLHAASRLHYDFRLEWEGVLLSWAVPKGPSYNPRDKRLAVHVEDHPLDYRNFEGTIPEGEYGGGTVMIWDQGTWQPLEDVGSGMKNGMLKMTLQGERLKGNWVLVRMKPRPGEEDKNWLLIKEKDDYVQSDSGIKQYDTSVVTNRTMAQITSDAAAELEQDSEDSAESEQDSEDSAESGQDSEAKVESEQDNVNINIQQQTTERGQALIEEIKSDKDFLSGRLPFHETDMMLAKLADKAPAGSNWIHEIKFDGYRILTFSEDNTPRLITRSGLDWTEKFPSIASSLTDWNPGNMILDGEIVVLTETGHSDFQGLQSAIKNPENAEIYYVVFDLLALGSLDLRNAPLLTRKELLAELIETAPENILYSFHQVGHGQEIFRQACADRQEGIVSKRTDSKYQGGRGDSWLKIKCDNRQEFVIGGYTATEKSTTGLSALLLGVNDDEGLVYAGRAGTGFSDRTAKELLSSLNKLKRKTSPFTKDIKERSDESLTYVTPKLIAEIKYAEMTKDGLLRQASFKGLRSDKESKSVVLESPAAEVAKMKEEVNQAEEKAVRYGEVILTSPARLVFPDAGISKRDVADYYWALRDKMLPYIINRPLTLIRCTDGIAKECFYQKNMYQTIPGMDLFPFKSNSGKDSQAMIIRDEEGLMGSVQMGAVEFHGWGSVIDHLELPDMMVFDLDPDKGLGIDDIRRAVRDLKGLLDDTDLTSFLKTSGGKGYHIVVPLQPAADWAKVRDFAKLIAQTMTEKWPHRYTANMRKEKRAGRVYVDWVRNGRSATSVANFSLRSRPGAAVSWPLRWSDLSKILPDDVTMHNYNEYMKTLKGWDDFFQQDQMLK